MKVTNEDEQVLEAKKSFEMAEDSATMINQASKSMTKEIKKEPVEKPKSL